MIQTQTILKVADNSGAKTAKCIKILGPRGSAFVGDCILVSIRSLRGRTIQKGQIYKALVIRTKKSQKISKCGHQFAFSSNSVALLAPGKPASSDDNLIGSRVFGPITRELRAKNFTKVISQSKRML